MSTDPTLLKRLTELRESFDSAFGRPPTAALDSGVRLLAIRIGRDAYAVGDHELAEVQGGACKVVPLPGARPELLGLVGVRGRVLPVYSLGALLGHARDDSWRWLAVTSGDNPLALTFDELEGYVQTSRANLFPAPEVERSRGHVREVLRVEGTTRMVVSISSIVASLSPGFAESARGSR